MHPETGTTTSPVYVWKPAEKLISVQIQFDVIDKILLEVMRGFGAVPKRGAEVGGILLGTAETSGDRTVVKIEDFEMVGCDHASGPSFILSEDNRASFAGAANRWRHGPDRRMYAVGYYRGHTREGICLGAEDLSILEEFFPEPSAIALVVKPYATKVSMAGIFFREDGQFRADSSHLEFPFRRKELGGGISGTERLAAAARFGQQRTGEDPRVAIRAAELVASSSNQVSAPIPAPEFGGLASAPVETSKGKGVRGGWVWIPLSFIFMLLGVVLGFQIALSMRPKQPANPWLEAWDMALQVKRTGDELTVTWDPLAPPVRNATRGALIIQSRDETRTIDLRAPQLQGGSVIYRGVPERVIFRLETYPRERVVVSEIAEFKKE
ncbi:MAG: hypothetical protein HYX27_21120 [Acidobacteria bacterium]|nr:hypothetical protein [Acidobacteriota bacterium]